MNCNECDRKVVRRNAIGQCQWCSAEEARILNRAESIAREKHYTVAEVNRRADLALESVRLADAASKAGPHTVPPWFAAENLILGPAEVAARYRTNLAMAGDVKP
jgi:hypothetical protein